jgi:restriction system protein
VFVTAEMRAWTVRTGKHGERDDWAIDGGLCGGGWREIPDLTNISSKPDMEQMVSRHYGLESPGRVSNYTGQLWALRARIQDGDLAVLPLKTTHQIAVGRVNRPYFYISDEADDSKRHAIGVEWKRTDVARTAIKQDLLYILGSALTVFQSQKSDAVWRLEQVLAAGVDPGARSGVLASASGGYEEAEAGSAADGAAIDVEDYGRTRIQTLIQENFKGHELARLVEAVLVADGFSCERKPPGADGGVDILAGRGPLGLDAPRVVVQVKSDAQPVGDPVVQTLQGAITRFNADQALLVAWGGVNRNAEKFLETTKFTIRVWDSSDLMNALFRCYDRLPEDLRADLPLKQIWIDVPAGPT